MKKITVLERKIGRGLMCFLLCVWVCPYCFAQNYQDVVYLKNGSIIRGMIVEHVPNKTVKIETTDGSVFICSVEEIEKFAKEKEKENEKPLIKEKTKERDTISNRLESDGLKPGFKMIAEFGYDMSIEEKTDYDWFRFNVIVGGQFNPYFSMGLGLGLRYNESITRISSNRQSDLLMVPVFVDCRWNFGKRKITPYLSLDVGYLFSNERGDYDYDYDYNYRDGAFVNPTFGVSFKISHIAAVNVGMGVDFKNISNLDSSKFAICVTAGICW
ncbi:MAG: hypothetical protein LBF89_01580 [Bacteroidales bacterium]|jgi:hypothetical protein|nr:hypothetical protein [Bacteroidales bacterium]